ncbi:unnamed protein product [Rotaria magnacalcarata]|uniref:Cupin type-1 domain-containing protein n=1 Tax=Rotaria magnacalcarata TaxID=392030 RepID=A0A815EL56_9BILA|nr:unnamed protein product [Rotaria magnacalcarata]CAF1311841.1 unnamed protein product [Rotaria magnacalcarata]CAF2112211.1 unnamed protein product [Rotaria magnacalcarata]
MYFIVPSDCTSVSPSFIFPPIKSDPYPVLLQGPAGEIFNFAKIGYTTNNSYALAYVALPPNSGPPAHIHHWTNEWFYFPEGGVVIFSSYQMFPNDSMIPNGNQLPKTNMHRYLTKPGDLIYGPAFYVHGYRNEDNVTHNLITVWTPDLISQYFFAVSQILTSPFNIPPVANSSKTLFVTEAPKYGINMSAYWDEYVANWTDDWQPPLGPTVDGQSLLSVLQNDIVQNSTLPPIISYAVLTEPSSALKYLFLSIIFEIFFSAF